MSDFADPIEQLFYEQLVWKFMPEFVAAAEKLDVPNDALKAAADDMRRSPGGMGDAFAYLCEHVISMRRMGTLFALIKPGELEAAPGGISVKDLAEREARTRGDA